MNPKTRVEYREHGYRQTGVWVLPALFLAVLIAAPFSSLMGPWAMLIGLPAAAALLFLLDRFGFNADLSGLAFVLLLLEFGGFVALLVKVAKGQGEAVGWWLPALEAIALVVVVRWAVRARRRRRRRGKVLALDDLSLGEVRKVMALGKAAVGHAERLVAGQPAADRAGAIRDLRRRMKRRSELAPVVAAVISERRQVWGWAAAGDPPTLALAAELVNEAAAATPARSAP